MSQLKTLADKLNQLEQELQKKKRFCKEHNFNKEAEHVGVKISVISEIRMECEIVASGARNINDINLSFDHI